MSPDTFIDPQLTYPDLLVLNNLLSAIETRDSKNSIAQSSSSNVQKGNSSTSSNGNDNVKTNSPNGDTPKAQVSDGTTVGQLDAWNDIKSESFEPTVFVTWDFHSLFPAFQAILVPYIKWAQTIVRNPTDVVMVTHLAMYATTSLPSAVYLYYNFNYFHGVLHWLMQSWFVGTYTLMRHQHIHAGGILAKKFPMNWIDGIYPYITDPLHGHTWNTYYYHHVKHHHVEANGPNDLSSTLRYQRDDLLHFLHYVGRFFFFVWLDLPLYFVRKQQYVQAMKAAFWELGSLAAIALMARWQFKPALFTLILPLTVIRMGLMVGNWGQHALVDEVEPDSDFRSSITLIDVASNRFSFNDGYHTSHHLNPRRHWRDHPNSFVMQKERYTNENALVFRNIDYIMMSITLLRKDYDHLAKCLVPIGDQIDMTMQERADMLRTKTRVFSEEEIEKKFGVKKNT